MRALVTVLMLCGLLSVPRSEELPLGYIPLEVGSSGNWTVVCSGPCALQLKLKDAAGSVITTDTLHPPETRTVFEGWVLPNLWREGEFFVSSKNNATSKHTLWLLDARSKKFKKIMARELPVGNVVAGCKGTRLLVSSSGRITDHPSTPSLTTLIDADSGRVVREWEGLYVHPWGAGSSQYARYDESTESIWIFPTWIHPDHPLASETPEHMIRVHCAYGDTNVIREDILFGESIGEYIVPIVYQGHMVVETRQGIDLSLKDDGYRRVMLVDMVNGVVLGKWLLGPLEAYSDRIEGMAITDDFRRVVYLLTNEAKRWDIVVMRVEERGPQWVAWEGDEPPRLSRDKSGSLLINGKTLEQLGLIGS